MEKDKQNIISKTVGATIKYSRMNAAISIAKLSSDLQINPSTIVSIEDGKHQASFCIIYSMINYFKIDPNILFNQIETLLQEDFVNKNKLS